MVALLLNHSTAPVAACPAISSMAASRQILASVRRLHQVSSAFLSDPNKLFVSCSAKKWLLRTRSGCLNQHALLDTHLTTLLAAIPIISRAVLARNFMIILVMLKVKPHFRHPGLTIIFSQLLLYQLRRPQRPVWLVPDQPSQLLQLPPTIYAHLQISPRLPAKQLQHQHLDRSRQQLLSQLFHQRQPKSRFLPHLLTQARPQLLLEPSELSLEPLLH